MFHVRGIYFFRKFLLLNDNPGASIGEARIERIVPLRPELSHPVFGLVDRLRSSLRTGRRLHLDPEHAQVLMSEEIYAAIAKLEAEEIRRICQAGNANDIKSVTFGFGSDRASAPGRSAGSNELPMDAVSRGASQLLSEEAALMLRRKKH